MELAGRPRDGHAISDQGYGNFKLPVLFMAMLLPLVFTGAGRLSVDALLWRWHPSGTTARPAFR